MSIFFDFDVGPNGRRFRRAVGDDKSDIELFYKQTYKLFGEVDIGTLIELSVLSICMLDKNKMVTGFLALDDHPNIPGINPSEWEFWIRNMFQRFYLSRNTLFVHYMCCDDSVTGFFLEEALTSVFRNDVYLHNIIIVIPTGCPTDALKLFQEVRKCPMQKFCNKSGLEEFAQQCLYVASRKDYCPKLKIRRAVEEDNDDVVEILDKICPKLKKLYGDYYISEIVGRYPESKRKIVVATQFDTAVGVMCINSDINYEMLLEKYELKPYNGLTKITPLEKEKMKRENCLLKIFGETIMTGQWNAFENKRNLSPSNSDTPNKIESSKSLGSIFTKATIDDKGNKVNYSKRRNTILMPMLDNIVSVDYSEYSNIFLSIDSILPEVLPMILEDDPFEYEIVNIDEKLLKIPHISVSKGVPPTPRDSSEYSSRKNIHQHRMSIRLNEHDHYSGEPNAFMIEIFGLCHSIEERNAKDMLEAAFEIMKVYDYCLIRVPCSDMYCPLLQHFTFVPTKSRICCDYALYVAHRSSFLGKLRVRRAEIIDIPQIAILLQRLDVSETLKTVELSVMNTGKYNSYVFFSDLSLIGIGILEECQNIDTIRGKYDFNSLHIQKYHNKGHVLSGGFAILKTILVYPVFEAHFRYFIRDMLRLSGQDSLIWMTSYRSKLTTNKANTAVASMILLLPRKIETEIIYESDSPKSLMPFSTWFLGKKQTSISKVNIDTRILIVGASRTAFAFLDSLLFSDSSSYLTFTNITLVTQSGLPYSKYYKSHVETMFPQNPSDKYIKSMPYTYYVNVVHGTVVEINKEMKYIKLSNGSKCEYDRLFLFFGKQFQCPCYFQKLQEKKKEVRRGNIKLLSTRFDVTPKKKDICLMKSNPDNLFVINNSSDANKAIAYINHSVTNLEPYKVVIYGCSLTAYCCLTSLLEMNLPQEDLILIEPFPLEHPTKPRIPVFCNAYVYKNVWEEINLLKVTTYRSCYIQSCQTDETGLISEITILSDFQLIRIKCSALIYYGIRGFDAEALYAIEKCGIAFDNGVLIDHNFKTSASSVYSAGSFTNYNRRYRAENQKQKYCDSYDIGFKLGEQIRNDLDPLFKANEKADDTILKNESEEAQNSVLNAKLPVFTKPIVVLCKLPGGLQYLDVRPPGIKLSDHYLQSLDFNGMVMETFNNGYFKLHTTRDLVVNGITCLTKESYSLGIYASLYGMSSSLLNNVFIRFAAKKIDDFYSFFNAPWASFLYHERVIELLAMVKELFPKGEIDGKTMKEALRSLYIGDRTTLQFAFDKDMYLDAINDYVIAWLSENDIVLPMYMQPNYNAEFAHDLSRHPAFKKKTRRIRKMLI